MADIVITTDFSQVNQLNDTLKSTGNLFTRVVDSLLREETRAKRVTKALAKTTEDNLALIEKAEAIVAEKVQVAAQKREKARQRESDRAEKEAKRIAAAAEKAAKAEAKLAEEIASNQAKAAQQSTANLNQRLGVTGSSAMNSGAGFGALEQEIERLRQKYDSVYSASQLYEKSLMELDRAHMLGVTSVKQHEAALEQLNTEYQQFSNAAEGAFIAGNRFSQHINQSGSGLNKFGMYAQQVGYQVGDFFVQVQSGTNVLVAFGQQATQLAGLIPGIWGAAIGIGISLATALGSALMKAGEAADGSKKALEEYQGVLETLKTKTAEVNLSLEALRRGVSADTFLEATLAIEDLNDQLSKLRTEELSGFMDVWTRGDRIVAAQALKVELEKALEILKQQQAEEQRLETAATRRANEVRNQYREEKKFKDLAKASTEALESVMQSISTMDLSGPFRKLLGPIQAAIDKARELAANDGGMVSGPASNNINGLGNLNLPLGMVPTALGGIAPSSSQRPQGRPTDIDFGYYPDTKTGSGGSKTNSIDSLINQLQTERETIDEWYVESQDALKSASETELQIIGGYNEAKLRLEQEYQDRLKGIRDESHSTLLSDTGSMFSALASISEAGGKRALKAQAVLSAAATMIAAYETAVKAAAEAKTIPGRIAAYAGFLATGLKAAASIRSIGGIGGGTGGVGSATVAATASAPSPQTVFIDSISPESLYSGETLINLFEAFYDENDKRGKVFMVAR